MRQARRPGGICSTSAISSATSPGWAVRAAKGRAAMPGGMGSMQARRSSPPVRAAAANTACARAAEETMAVRAPESRRICA